MYAQIKRSMGKGDESLLCHFCIEETESIKREHLTQLQKIIQELCESLELNPGAAVMDKYLSGILAKVREEPKER